VAILTSRAKLDNYFMKEEKKENYTAIFLMILVANILNKG
jgi:hypothetical protein